MKLKKKSGLISAVIALSCASIVSVGFASWVISQGDSKEVTGNITVDTVSDQAHVIKNAEGGTTLSVNYGNNAKGAAASSICFGWDDAGAVAPIWLTNTDANTVENLDAQIVCYVSNLAADQTAKVHVSIELTGTDAQKDAFNSAVTNGYVGALTNVASFALASGEEGTYGRQLTVSLQFAWGSHFNVAGNPVNPYKFYNDGTKTAATDGADAQAALGAIEAFSGVGFKVTIEIDA